jgi:hypothetical protein
VAKKIIVNKAYLEALEMSADSILGKTLNINLYNQIQ